MSIFYKTFYKIFTCGNVRGNDWTQYVKAAETQDLKILAMQQLNKKKNNFLKG